MAGGLGQGGHLCLDCRHSPAAHISYDPHPLYTPSLGEQREGALSPTVGNVAQGPNMKRTASEELKRGDRRLRVTERVEAGRRELWDKRAVAPLEWQPAPQAAGVCSFSGSVLLCLWVSSGALSLPCFAFLGWNVLPSPSWGSPAAALDQKLLE